MFAKIIASAFYALFILVPLVFLPNTSELFEFNKLLIAYLLTGIIVAAWICRMISQKKIIFRHTLLDWPIIIFLAFQLLSLFFSIDVHTSLLGYYSRWNGGLLSLISYSLLYWAFVSNMDAKSTLRTLHFALSTAALVAIWGVLERLGIDKNLWVQDVQNRVFSTLGQPNWLAAYLVSLIFIPVSYLTPPPPLLTKERGIQGVRWLWLGISILLFCTLLFTRSRSGLLAFGIASTVYWLKIRSIRTFGIFTAVCVFLMLVFPNPIREIIFKQQASNTSSQAGTSLESGGTESGNIRKIVWTGATRIWTSSIKNLLIGTGPETFAMAYYQYRPIEHNSTTEWELLYNKAHNEFLNYLATTGILGLLSYVILLGAMFWVIGSQFIVHRKNTTNHEPTNQLTLLALLAGWLTILVTNFWGFSVVIMQILLFLLPAFAIVLSLPAGRQVLSDESDSLKMFFVFLLLISGPIFLVGRYWLADVDLAEAQKQNKYFNASQDPQYLLKAYQFATEAYKLNSGEPVIASELANAAAYLALAVSSQSTDSAQQLAELSLVTSQQAINTSPRHPNYYKSRARALILLSDFDPQYLEEAAKTLQSAMHISPTDPRLPYNLGVVYKYLDKPEKAKNMFNNALQLKPDFADPQKQLDEIASVSGKIGQ